MWRRPPGGGGSGATIAEMMAALNVWDVSLRGVVGDGVTLDTAAWQDICADVPSGTILLVPDPSFIMQIDDTFQLSDKEDVWIVSNLDGRNFAPSPVFRWVGANNGLVLDMDRCRACHVEGFQWRTTNGITVDTFINIDGYSGGHISTQNVVRYNGFNATNQLNADAKLVSISATVSNNCENMDVCDNTFGVSSGVRPAAGGIGIYVGPNPNAKHHRFHGNGILSATTGIYQSNGSCNISHLGGGVNETDIIIAESTEPTIVTNLETEASTRAMDHRAALGILIMDGCRFSNSNQTDAGGFLKLDGKCTIRGGNFETPPPVGGTAFEDGGVGNLSLTVHDTMFRNGPWTWAETGFDHFESVVDSRSLVAWNNNRLVGAPSRYFVQFNGQDPNSGDTVGFYFGSPIRIRPRTFAQVTGGGAFATAGTLATISDSTTDVWGATITGGGGLNVLGRFNGTNWTVVGI